MESLMISDGAFCFLFVNLLFMQRYFSDLSYEHGITVVVPQPY